jgi:deoxyguanosine kinase
MGRPRFIVVEGPIGVGKTSFVNLLAPKLGASKVLEEVDSNPFLARFYRDRRSLSFQTQLYFLLTRYQQQLELSQQDLFRQSVVADYLFAKDKIFAQINLSDDELALYNRIYPLLVGKIPRPDLVIYLQASTETLKDRVKKRHGAFDRYIDDEYLERLNQAYNHFFFYYSETPLLVIQTSGIDFVQHKRQLDDLLDKIEKTDEGTQYYVPPSE